MSSALEVQKEVYSDLLTKSQTALKSMVDTNSELLDRIRELSSELDQSKRFNRDTLNGLMADTNSLLAEFGINNVPIPEKKENPLSIVPGKEDEP